MPHAAADEIASLVLEQFDRLPTKRKPAVRDNGIHEWVPLSAIVAEADGSLKCLSLATGMKCLPATKLSLSHGTALHDWHAEVLAIRALNHFLLEECKAVASGKPSAFIRARTSQERQCHGDQGWQGQPFALRDGVTLHMYCSEAPCGDASMELTMAAQDDAAPWEIPAPATASEGPNSLLSGRAFFSRLGTVRRKPARGDAPPTLSKSCSDKLALKQCTSLLSSLTSLLIHPGNVYISSLVLPESQFSATGCARSFSAAGRMRSVAGRHWPGGYAFREFEVRTTSLEFAFSKRAVAERSSRTSASNLAVAMSAAGVDEGLVGGVLQGRKQFDGKGASVTSRKKKWALALGVARLDGVGSEELRSQLQAGTYGHVKEGVLLEGRRRAKDDARSEALQGWVRNIGDESFAP
ncbi:adenosine-deaminase domain-containing protein [Coniochaeta ligniaria NRRL 30616]|uniref:Adenosine-deaminase domain-containing protein n=1 Tax=Coniochaeta ligniaria NRRL 30616 TaxID=1408157 RepID=A0A1J7IW23_9PEZI|nr:adenosine-deaminase domain-containing protein [Coniochaeta ligniaria NRRL 30616]